MAMLTACSVIPVARNARAYSAVKTYVDPAETALQVDPVTGVVAQRLKINTPFCGFSVKMPTWYSSDSKATFAVYEWKNNYYDTVRGKVLREKRLENLVDNAVNSFEFTENLPEGEYLFVIKDIEGVAGSYARSRNSISKGFVYYNGVEMPYELVMEIFFPEKVKSPFEKCESAAEKIEEKSAPAEYVIPSDSLIYTHEAMPDTWVFTDALGRKSLSNKDVGDPRSDKTVALFYWTWHGSEISEHKNVTNNQLLIEENPDAANKYYHKAWPRENGIFYWNEPIYGYYKTTDEWVLRRQAELLANAGVDTIFTDNTNGTSTWGESYTKLFATWSQAMDDGVKTPKVSFMLPFSASSDASTQLKMLYSDIYEGEKYQKLWFYWDGKPMLMAWTEMLDTNVALERQILQYFTFRKNYAEYIDKNAADHYRYWGWLSVYPQAYYFKDDADREANKPEQITVGVSQNHNYVTHKLAAMNGENITGRSYTSDLSHMNELNSKLYGYNFTEQFEYALKIDPKVIFVTGWNEWTAHRNQEWQGTENGFADEFTDEFSRDIEPTRGELGDNYYYQFVNFVRKYKGVRRFQGVSSAASIDLSAGQEQWKTVAPYYAAYIGNTGSRNSTGAGDYVYTDYSGRNDIIGAQVARDDAYLYFNVECRENITPYTDLLWMNLYIDTDGENTGWNSFNYVLNKTAPTATKAVLEKFTGTSYDSAKVAECDYTVDGRYLTVKISKADLGISGDNFSLSFAWTDNVHDEADKGTGTDASSVKYSQFSGDILDFYTSGDVAPGGRFKFYYDTAIAAGSAESSDGSSDSASEKSGNSLVPVAIGAAAVAAAAIGATVFMLKPKKKKQ